MSRHTFLVLLLSWVATACDGSPSAPEGALIGEWGGDGIKVEAEADRVRVTFRCFAMLEARTPLVPLPDGRFLISDVESTGNWPSQSVTLRGTASESEIRLEVVMVRLDETVVTEWTAMKDQPALLDAYCLVSG